MANRTYNQFAGTLERKVVKLFAKIIYDAGAPVLVTQQIINAGTSPVTVNPSQGIQSLVDDAAGVFTLVLGANNGGTQTAIGSSTTLFTTVGAGVPTYDPYVRLLDAQVCSVGSFGGSTNNPISAIVSVDNVNGASGNPSLQFTLITTAGAFVDPADGQIVLVEITLSNTTAY